MQRGLSLMSALVLFFTFNHNKAIKEKQSYNHVYICFLKYAKTLPKYA